MRYNMPPNLTDFSTILIPTTNYDLLEGNINWDEKPFLPLFNHEQHEL